MSTPQVNAAAMVAPEQLATVWFFVGKVGKAACRPEWAVLSMNPVKNAEQVARLFKLLCIEFSRPAPGV